MQPQLLRLLEVVKSGISHLRKCVVLESILKQCVSQGFDRYQWEAKKQTTIVALDIQPHRNRYKLSLVLLAVQILIGPWITVACLTLMEGQSSFTIPIEPQITQACYIISNLSVSLVFHDQPQLVHPLPNLVNKSQSWARQVRGYESQQASEYKFIQWQEGYKVQRKDSYLSPSGSGFNSRCSQELFP